jgi:hypothetical protein
LIDVGELATINGLMKELDIKERLEGLIINVSNNCLWCGGSCLSAVLRGNAANLRPAKSRLMIIMLCIAHATSAHGNGFGCGIVHQPPKMSANAGTTLTMLTTEAVTPRRHSGWTLAIYPYL